MSSIPSDISTIKDSDIAAYNTLSASDICIVNDSYDESTGREISKHANVHNLTEYITNNFPQVQLTNKIRVPYDIDHQSVSLGKITINVNFTPLYNENKLRFPIRLKFYKDNSHFYHTGVIEPKYIVSENTTTPWLQTLTVPVSTSHISAVSGVWYAKVYDSMNNIYRTSAWRII